MTPIYQPGIQPQFPWHKPWGPHPTHLDGNKPPIILTLVVLSKHPISMLVGLPKTEKASVFWKQHYFRRHRRKPIWIWLYPLYPAGAAVINRGPDLLSSTCKSQCRPGWAISVWTVEQTVWLWHVVKREWTNKVFLGCAKLCKVVQSCAKLC